MKNMRSPLGRVRGLGSARAGTEHWWAQRLTSLALIPLVLWFVVAMVRLVGADHATAVAWLQAPLNAVLFLLLIVAVFRHMQLGLEIVIEDYVHDDPRKIALLAGVKLGSFALAVAAGFAVLKVALGG